MTPLEDLLRGSALSNGTIALSRITGGAWRAVIVHHRQGEEYPFDHMVHPGADLKEDPVEALRVALIEDDRRCREVARRYQASEKFGPDRHLALDNRAGIDPEFDAADEMDDLLG